MRQDQSYWAILYFIHREIKYFIIIGAIALRWWIEYGFPKWHPEPEDNWSILANIIREIQEETGIQSDQLFLDNFDETKVSFSLSYEFEYQGERIKKMSTYYAVEMKEMDPLTLLEVPSDFVSEISKIHIVTETEVVQLLSHDNERRLFEKWGKANI